MAQKDEKMITVICSDILDETIFIMNKYLIYTSEVFMCLFFWKYQGHITG